MGIISFQEQGKIKSELQPFKVELAQRNLDVLAKVPSRRSSIVRK